LINSWLDQHCQHNSCPDFSWKFNSGNDLNI